MAADRDTFSMDAERDRSQDRERSVWVLASAVLLSVVAHVTLMLVLSRCSFNTFAGAAQQTRKWTRDVPKMHMRRHTGDPLAEPAKTTGRAAPAPVVESERDRVTRLAEPPEAKALALPAAAVAAPKAAAAEPPAVSPAEWRPSETARVLDHPVADDAPAPAPEAVSEAVPSPPATDAALTPAAVPERVVPITAAATSAGPAVDALAAPAAPMPPPPQTDAAFGWGAAAPAAAPAAAVKAPEEPAAATAAAAASFAETATAVLPRVDEAVVAAEKRAVDRLRDEQAAAPLAPHVSARLAAWTDPAHPAFRYFRLRLTPRADHPLDVVAKDVVYLLDASGSIADDRLAACAKAVSKALRTLNGDDRFNIVAFRDKFTYHANAWQPVNDATLGRADAWLSKLRSRGRTDVFQTLRSVLTLPRSPARALIALVMTDGEATQGMTRSSEIVSAFTELNGGLAALYFYGVKDSANAYLLDMLSYGNRGAWTCHTGLRWFAAGGIPAMAASFADPVLTDVTVTFASSARAEAYPLRPIHLYRDGAIDLYGVCPAACRELTFSVRGLNGAAALEDVFRLPFDAAAPGTGALKSAWAERRAHALVGEYARAPSPELKRDLVLFARHYGIGVPYADSLQAEAAPPRKEKQKK